MNLIEQAIADHEAAFIELRWWRELASRLVPGCDLPEVGEDLGPYRYRISRAGYIEEKP